MPEVIVIGAGLGGLSAAISLAARGVRVRVIEAAAGPGGKAGVVHLDGVEVDTGPTVLTLPGVLDRVLRLGHSSLQDQISLVSASPGFRYIYPDGVQLDVHHQLEDTLDSVGRTLGAPARAELEAFMVHARALWELSAPAFVMGPAPSFSSLLQLGVTRLWRFFQLEPFSSMWSGITRRVTSPHLRWLLARYATYNGSDVRSAPGTLNCIAHVELGMGAFGVQGGIYEVVRALVRVAHGLGVRFQYGAPVAQILERDGAVGGVRLASGELVSADAVVCNADAAQLLQDLLPEGRRRRQRGEPSLSGWTGIVRARRGTAGPRAPHTVLFPKHYLKEFEHMFDQSRAPDDPTLYICAQEAAHGRAGWAHDEPLFIMANAPAVSAAQGGEWPNLTQRAQLKLVEAGLIQPEDQLVWQRSPAQLAQRFPGSQGSLYGLASNNARSAFHRPANRAPWMRGLYLASGSAHPGGGMPLCLQSGLNAAGLLLKDLGRPVLAAPAEQGVA